MFPNSALRPKSCSEHEASSDEGESTLSFLNRSFEEFTAGEPPMRSPDAQKRVSLSVDDVRSKAASTRRNMLPILLYSSLLAFFLIALNNSHREELYRFNEADLGEIVSAFKDEIFSNSYVPLVDAIGRHSDHSLPRFLIRSVGENCQFASVGGINGKICLLHGTLFEMLLVWQAELPSSGWIGANLMNSTIFLANGYLKQWSNNTITRVAPGTNVTVAFMDESYIEISRKSWGLMYARGLPAFSGIKLFLGAVTTGSTLLSSFKIMAFYFLSFMIDLGTIIECSLVSLANLTAKTVNSYVNAKI